MSEQGQKGNIIIKRVKKVAAGAHGGSWKVAYADLVTALDVVRKLNPSLSFPTIVIGDKVIVGFHRDELEKALAGCSKS